MNVQRKSARKSHFKHRSRILFLLPSMAGVTVFVLLPFLDMVKRSVQTAVTGAFCGIHNYEVVFTNQAFLTAVKNTLRFVGVGLPLLILISLGLSLAVNRSRWMQEIKSMFLFPLAVPTAAVVLIWKLLFYKNGVINTFLMDFNQSGIDWLGSDASFWVLILSYLWKNTGYTMVLWLAGLKNISTSLMEAARMDGASEKKCFWHIVLPGLKPVFYTVVILSFLNSFQIFREAYLVSGAYPQEKMYLLQHLFNNWFVKLDVDKMAAAAVLIAVVFALFVQLLRKAWDTEG